MQRVLDQIQLILYFLILGILHRFIVYVLHNIQEIHVRVREFPQVEIGKGSQFQHVIENGLGFQIFVFGDHVVKGDN